MPLFLSVLASLSAAACSPADNELQGSEPEPQIIVEGEARDLGADCSGCPRMVAIPGGRFTMGSPASEKERHEDESPLHWVTVAPYAIGKHEVTWAEWELCVAEGGCDGTGPAGAGGGEGWGKGRRPVINVSWYDARDFIRWLSEKTGKSYRLPSEAEWEFAARAGTTTPFSFGETIVPEQANYDANYAYGNGSTGKFRQQTVPVGMFPANGFGLHDMHGNAYEWVADCYRPDYEGAPADGSPREDWPCGSMILQAPPVFRGGSWNDIPSLLRSAYRARTIPDYRSDELGFRVARTP